MRITVQVRDITAQCPACKGDEFQFLVPSEVRNIRMRCAGCGEQLTYGELADLIGELAMRRARESLKKTKSLKDLVATRRALKAGAAPTSPESPSNSNKSPRAKGTGRSRSR